MTPLLSVENLRVLFGDKPAVDGVSFTLNPGETLALVGESGSGKSLTALSTVRLTPPSAKLSGSVRYLDREMLTADETTLRDVRGDDVSFIFQEPMTSLNPLHSVASQIGESLALHQGVTGAEARDRIVALLDRVGIRNPAQRLDDYPHQLSGGQRQRVMIAMALTNKPKLLIADEPTTALDVTVQAQILDLLKELQAEEGLALLFITHDLTIVRRMAGRVCVMKDGRIVEEGATAPLFAAPQHAYTRKLIESAPKGRPDPVAPDAAEVLRADDLKVWFPIRRGLMRRTVGHVKAVDGVSFALRETETLGLVGESGSGKTTLALAALRLIRSEGPVVFLGDRIDGLPPRALRRLRRDLQVVFQDPYGALSPRLSVGDIVAEGLGVHGVREPGVSRREAVAAALAEVGLDPDAMDRYPHEFSGGQRQRIAIARAMILRPRVVALDEPTSALDLTVQAQIVELLRGLQRERGLAYLFISHDLKVVRAMAHRVMVMRAGKVVEQGEAEALFSNPREDYTRALRDAAGLS